MKKSIYKLLSYPLNENTPLYGDTDPLKIKPVRQIKSGDSCNTALVTFSNHMGTHVDAPKHFFDSGRSISEHSINELIFDLPFILDCPKKDGEMIEPDDLMAIERCDLLLIRTGFHKFRKNKIYRTQNPGISEKAAHYIRHKHPCIKAVGIDTISISSYQNREEGRKAHRMFLKNDDFSGCPLILIEDMDLNADLRKLSRVFVVPLFIEGVDSVPCTIIGEFDGEE